MTDKVFAGEILPVDEHLAHSGRVMEILSEHTCQGWLEGYLLTGRHGVFSCYEAFIHIVDAMLNQHAKWLKTTRELEWRPRIASLNYLLSSHVWRQDHNGFSHQDPGFIDHVVNKRPRWSASTCRRTPTPCCPRCGTASRASTTSTSWWPASSRSSTGWTPSRPTCTAPAASASGSGPHTRATTPTS